jgi:hypothetical protein
MRALSLPGTKEAIANELKVRGVSDIRAQTLVEMRYAQTRAEQIAGASLADIMDHSVPTINGLPFKIVDEGGGGKTGILFCGAEEAET